VKIIKEIRSLFNLTPFLFFSAGWRTSSANLDLQNPDLSGEGDMNRKVEFFHT